MIETDYMAGRIKELADRAYKNDYITHTAFLGASEQASFHSALKKLGVPKLVQKLLRAGQRIDRGDRLLNLLEPEPVLLQNL